MKINSRIGILGGTFDPIHHAHLRLAEEVAESYGLEEVQFIPSADPPHRERPQTSANDRYEMVRLAVESNKKFIANPIELDRSGKSYMVDTLTNIREINPDASINLILGTDAFIELMGWNRWKQLFTLANIVVAYRPTVPLEKLANKLKGELLAEFTDRHSATPSNFNHTKAGQIFTYRFTSLAISSSSLRERIQKNMSLEYLLPNNVIKYILDNSLYTEITPETKSF